MISALTVDQVTSFKLLGVTVMDSLKRGDHIGAVTAKTAKRLGFKKKLKRAGITQSDVFHYNEPVIRPVL